MQILYQCSILVFVAALFFGVFAQIGQFCLLDDLRAYIKKQSSQLILSSLSENIK